MHINNKSSFTLPTLLVFTTMVMSSCASKGAQPHDMSISEHERSAERELEEAERHEAQFDPDAWSAGDGECDTYCFDIWTNPTSVHKREARKHRAMAAEHRQASELLRAAEARACTGIPERNWDLSPFFHTDDIEGISGLESEEGGFVVRFKAIEGVDAEAMQHLLDCHLARNSARGHVAPEMDYCPLVPKGVRASVSPGASGLVVEIEAESIETRAEVRDRLKRLDERLMHDHE